MHFSSLAEFLEMGGYAPYVWSGVIGSLGALIGVVVLSMMQHKQVKQQILQQQKRDERVKAAKEMENTL